MPPPSATATTLAVETVWSYRDTSPARRHQTQTVTTSLLTAGYVIHQVETGVSIAVYSLFFRVFFRGVLQWLNCPQSLCACITGWGCRQCVFSGQISSSSSYGRCHCGEDMTILYHYHALSCHVPEVLSPCIWSLWTEVPKNWHILAMSVSHFSISSPSLPGGVIQ